MLENYQNLRQIVFHEQIQKIRVTNDENAKILHETRLHFTFFSESSLQSAPTLPESYFCIVGSWNYTFSNQYELLHSQSPVVWRAPIVPFVAS